MSATTETTGQRRLHTIGAVCERLRDEFPDISISKIRYLEDQGLIQPKRTRGGYRLFAEPDIERLVTILRLQRDEFLPLRVIRDELDSPSADRARRRAQGLRGAGGRDRHVGALRARGRDTRLRAPARGLRPAAAADRGRRPPVPRERGGDRSGVRAHRAPRHRRAPPARVPDGRRPPVGAARAARRARAAVTGPRSAASRRTGRSRDAGRASRRSWRSCCSCATCARWPTDDRRRPAQPHPRRAGLPDGGDPLQGHHAARRRAGGVPCDDRPARGVGGTAATGRDPRRRGARFHLRRGTRLRARLRVRHGAQAGQAALEDGRRELRARVRARHPRGARRRDRLRRTRDRPRRRARHGWHGPGEDRPRRAAGRDASSAPSS